MRQAVHEYVKKKRGFYAADDGEVPEDDDSKSDDDSSDDDDSKSDDDAPADPPADVNSSAAAAPDAKADPAADLQGQYATAADPQAVKDAVTASKRQNLIAGLTDAAIKIATARGVANGMTPDNGSSGKSIREQGNQGIAVAQANRQNAIQGFLQKQAIQHQVIQNGLLSQDAQTKHQMTQAAIDRDTPGSALSNQAAAGYKASFGEDPPPGMSANDIAALTKTHLNQDHNQTLRDDTQTRADAGKAARIDADTRRQTAADAKTAAKTAADEPKSFLEMENKGMGGRGAPQYVTKNMVTQQSIRNAQDMIDKLPKKPDGSPDYDKMNDKQVHLFNGELEKIATNGAPTESGRQAMEADTLAANWQAFKQKFAGKPLPADVGEFVKQNADYLSALKENIDGSVNKFRRENFENYVDAGKVSGEHADKYRAKHPELFPEDQTQKPPPAAPPQGGPGMAIGAPSAKLDPKITSYAATNQIDYAHAKAILSKRGYTPNE